MAIYRPRWAATLTLTSAGKKATRIAQEDDDSTTTIALNVGEFSLEQNDHTHADVLRLTCDWQGIGLDPRLVRNGNVAFFLDDANESGEFAPTDKNCRFIGQIAEVERSSAEGEPYEIRIEALDYTDFFLRAKPFGARGIPDYSQTLDDAWRRVVSQTPGAALLADRIYPYGFSGFPRLGDAVASRFASLARVPTQSQTDAWAVWQQCIGMMALISFFEKDRLIVTTADAYYATKDPPVLIWGKNIAEMTESRDLTTFSKGVGLSSFDPLTHRTLESRYPKEALARGVKAGKKKVKASPILTAAEGEFVKEYDYYSYPGVTNQAQLDKICQRAWEERSRQEVCGTLITSEMRAETESGDTFDLLNLKAGDNIKIAVNENEIDTLRRLDTDAERIRYLKEQGYQEDAARLIAETSSDLELLDHQFYVRRVMTRGSTDGTSGKFDVEVTYCNRILIGGDATAEQ